MCYVSYDIKVPFLKALDPLFRFGCSISMDCGSGYFCKCKTFGLPNESFPILSNDAPDAVKTLAFILLSKLKTDSFGLSDSLSCKRINRLVIVHINILKLISNVCQIFSTFAFRPGSFLVFVTRAESLRLQSLR